jgi:2-methylisocitrate lyase-like PEP mutase family enzyme
MGERTDLRAVLERDGGTVLPGVYDGISARIADRMGFAGLYMTRPCKVVGRSFVVG